MSIAYSEENKSAEYCRVKLLDPALFTIYFKLLPFYYRLSNYQTLNADRSCPLKNLSEIWVETPDCLMKVETH